MFIKGGSIITRQSVDVGKLTNTHDLETTRMSFIIAPDHYGQAHGTIVFDHDRKLPSRDPRSNSYRHYSFRYFDKKLKINKLSGFDYDQTFESETFNDLIILDTLNNKDIQFAWMLDKNLNLHQLKFYSDPRSTSILIYNDPDD